MYQGMIDAMKGYDSDCTNTTTRIAAATSRQADALVIQPNERQRGEALRQVIRQRALGPRGRVQTNWRLGRVLPCA